MELKRAKNTIFAVIFILFILAVGVGLFYLFKLIWNSIIGLDNQIAIAIITASATVFVSVVSIIIGKSFENKRVIEQQNKLKKIDIYGYIVDSFFEFFKKSKINSLNSETTKEELEKLGVKITKDLVLWGGRNVIKEYVKFREFGKKPNKNDISINFQFENFLYALRKDLGNSNINLVKGDLLKLYIIDIDKYLTK